MIQYPPHLRLLAIVVMMSMLASCVTQFHVLDLAADLSREYGKAEPETEWNSLQVWRRVEDNPPAYIPSAYPATAPRTEKEGEWVTDRRDGKRLFVPKDMPPPMSTAVLIGEAKKVTANIKRSYTTTTPGLMLMP